MEKLKNGPFFIIILFALSFIFYWATTIGQKESDNENDQVQKEDVFQGYEKLPSFVSESRLNDSIVKMFLQDLMGTDYTLLIMLFDEEMLNESIMDMNELQLETYAEKVGGKIKNNKELVSARVINADTTDDIKRYEIELEFKDLTKKVIEIETNNGMIVTPIESLF
jgi:hypothetical protein